MTFLWPSCDLPGTDLQQLNEEKEYTPIFYQECSEIPTKEKNLVITNFRPFNPLNTALKILDNVIANQVYALRRID